MPTKKKKPAPKNKPATSTVMPVEVFESLPSLAPARVYWSEAGVERSGVVLSHDGETLCVAAASPHVASPMMWIRREHVTDAPAEATPHRETV